MPDRPAADPPPHRPAHPRDEPGHLPPKPAEMGWRDYLIQLLHTAAELEHSLMVQYLYAAYSIGGKDAAGNERRAREWRAAMLTVAKEEMAHLLTVQNCLCLLGGPITFDRREFPWQTPYHPFEFRLEPLTIESLAGYVFAEMPEDFSAEEQRDREAAEQAIAILGPEAGHPVGEVYESIIEIISDRERIPDSDFNAETYEIQASFDDWGRAYRPGVFKPHQKATAAPPAYERKTRLIIARMATRTEAIDALLDVAGQGESPHHRAKSKEEPSHFSRFAKIFRDVKRIQEKQPGWSPSRPMPVNPVVDGSDYAPGGSTPITAEPARTWAALFNIRYRILLTYLSHTFQLRRLNADGPDNIRAAVMSRVFGEMYNIKAISGILARLPLDDDGGPERAGPPFQMPYTMVAPATEVDNWRRHRDLVVSSQKLVEVLMAPGILDHDDMPEDGCKFLAALRDLDLQSLELIDRMLEGLQPDRRKRS